MVYRILGSWSESIVTHNSRPSYSSVYSGSSSINYWPSATDGSYLDINITSLYNDWMDGTYTNYGVAVVPGTSSVNLYQKDFISRDSAVYPEYKPLLIVTE